MKRKIIAAFLALATVAVSFCVLGPAMFDRQVRAASPVAGAFSAKAGSGGVTAKTFVKLSAARTIVASTAVTDSVVGVCELTAAANALTRYAPAGTEATVTSGELIAVGDLLTTGTGGKTFVLDADDASTQRVAAMALTAASGADEDVTVVVLASAVEQRLALASLAVGEGYGSTGVTISAAGVVQADGAITSDGAVTGGSLTDGTATLTAGAVTGTLDISGATVTYRSILNADVNASAAIARSKLAEDALAVYGIAAHEFRNDDGSGLIAAAENDLFGFTSAGMGTGTLTIDGDPASNESETSTGMFEFALPPEYVDAGDVQLLVTLRESVGAATVATTFSCEAYEDDGEGGVGANLAGSPDVTDVTTSWQTSTTAITAAGLVRGDKLRVFIRLVANDTGGAVGTIAQIGSIKIKIDVKG